MRRDVLLLLRGVLATAAVMLLVSGTGFVWDVMRTGVAFPSLSVFTIDEARQLTNVFSRASNQLMAVMFTTVAIAVPLTANMYSVKFLEFFIKDRVNATALTLVVFANLNTTMLAYATRNGYLPVVGMHLQLALNLLSFALLFPYLYYVFRFLHPNALLERLEEEIRASLERAARGDDLAANRRAAAEGLEHIANVAIRSVDRADRSTAMESILCLERVLHGYWVIRGRMPAAWFATEPTLFLGLSSKALEELEASRSWFEMKVFLQLRLVMSASVPKMHDVSSMTAKVLRKLGLDDVARQDQAIRELVVDYFNTFIRLSLTRGDRRSVFTLFDQYRLFAESINAEHPDLVNDIAFYFTYYGQVAREMGQPFIVEAIAHDFGDLVQNVWERRGPNADALLQAFLDFDPPGPLRGVKKAQALLAGFFLETGAREASERVARSFAGLDPAFITGIRDELLGVRREKFWEVNERRMNMDWVPESQKPHVRAFMDGVASRKG